MRLTPPTHAAFWTACFFTLLGFAATFVSWHLAGVFISISNLILIAAAMFKDT